MKERVLQRNLSVDNAKGWLILLVIIGHVALGSTEENPLRFFIYQWHMPAFVFISGLLINTDRLSKEPVTKILRHYFNRMGKSWLLAWLVYTTIVFHNSNSNYGLTIAKALANPYYHLWYVPSLMAMILVTALMARLRIKKSVKMVIVVLLCLLGCLIPCLEYYPRIMDFTYYIFFVAGIICATKGFTEIKHMFAISGGYLIFVALLYVVVLPKFGILAIRYTNLLPTLVLVIFGIAPLMLGNKLKSPKIITWIGQNSLYIYLWHVLPIMVFKYLWAETNILVYYLVNTLFLGIGLYSIFAYRTRKEQEII